MRNTGTGFAIGMGRFGAVVGPLLAGYLLGAPVEVAQIYTMFGLALLFAAGLIALLDKAQSARQQPQRVSPRRPENRQSAPVRMTAEPA